MEISHILEELAFEMGELPREAIEAAITKRSEISPHLLKILEDANNRIDEIIEHECYQGHLYAMYLLAQFRNELAYPLVIRLISKPGDIPHAILGDVLTEDLSRILASVCKENIAPLQNLIEDPKINEYVRASSQTSLVTLVGCGLLSRNGVISYFKTLFRDGLEKNPSFVWDNLVACSCDLYPDELYEDILRAFDEGLIDQDFISPIDIEILLSSSKEEHLLKLYENAELIEDTVSEMEKWICI